MRYDAILDLIFIFLISSFIGWVLEVLAVAIKEKRFVNRGITSGPMCLVYGICSVIILLITNDTSSILSLFIASIIYGTSLELIIGKVLEKFNKNKWWNYSNKKFNFDGYICLEYSLLWGILGVIFIKFASPFLLNVFNNINIYIRSLVVTIIFIITLIDLVTSFITLKIININGFENVSNRIGNSILASVQKRIENAYPNTKKKHKEKKSSNKFAEGAHFHKLFLIFFISSFIGAMFEMIFCRYTMHRWMSRSSLVFGEFSIVWGLGFVLATLCLHRYRNSNGILVFVIGSIMGGAFEYVCSVFTEAAFGTIFWDYSHLPFNLNGRINLLFCAFWGVAALIYIKKIYPGLSKTIESIPKKIGTIVTNILVVLFIIDLLITGCVMMRQTYRRRGIEAINIVEKLCDKYAPDDFMKKRWSNMKIRY